MNGTYVGANVDELSSELKKLLSVDVAGTRVKRHHITVIYSLVELDYDIVNIVLDQIGTPFKTEVIGAACFDALPSDDGTRDVNMSTIVLRLKSVTLEAVHNSLKSLGATHTYKSYEPHISIWYGVPREQAREVVDKLNAVFTDLDKAKFKVTVIGLYAEPLNPDWGKKPN